MTPAELLTAAREFVEQPEASTGTLWARSATLLTRQALEQAMAELLAARAPGTQAAPFSTQLLVLGEVLNDRELAARSGYVWSALSRASHQQGYELPPTAKELRRWIDVVDALAGVGASGT